jgi:hypothetical protein
MIPRNGNTSVPSLIFTPKRDRRISDTPTTENIAANSNSIADVRTAVRNRAVCDKFQVAHSDLDRVIFVCAAAKA